MNELIVKLRERRAALKAELEALAAPTNDGGEVRSLTEAESAEFDAKAGEVRALDARIDEIVDAEVREATAAKHLVESGIAERQAPTAKATVVSEPNPVYRRDRSESFFRDVAVSQLNMPGANEARSRLVASQETRAGDMTSVAGAGGEFAPPAWLVADFVKLARAGRVTADLLNKQTLPKGVSTVNLPAVATGATEAVQATQNTAVSDTAMTTTSISSGITLIAGKQIISRQLLDQSGIPFDNVILSDLAADYAAKLDVQVLTGSGSSGQLKGLDSAAGNTVTYTTTQPAVASSTNANSFYYQVVSAINKIQVNRYLAPTAIVMHPRRWNWILTALDGQNRPLVAPSTPVFNGAAGVGELVGQGPAGNLLGVPVYIDANVSTAANSSTNQDEVFVIRASDSWLYETDVESASFEATYADQASILFRVMGYSALLHRYSKAISKIVGTGLVDPGL